MQQLKFRNVIILGFFSFVALLVVCGLRTPNQKSTGKLERIENEWDSDSDGQVDGRSVTYSRDGIEILHTLYSKRNERTNIVLRIFKVKGKTIFIESDENGDGQFDKILAYGWKDGDFEGFTRLSNGAVEPISSDELLENKKGMRAIDKFIKNLFGE